MRVLALDVFLLKSSAWLGEVGMLVMTRRVAFILLCIGIQIMWNGLAELFGLAH